MNLYIQYNAFDVRPYCFPYILFPLNINIYFLFNMFIIPELALNQLWLNGMGLVDVFVDNYGVWHL